jgi:prephenate dehydrogenase
MNIVILGAGHMGSWLAENLKKTHHVGIYDKAAQKTKEMEDLTSFYDISAIQDFQPEILINAVSIQNTIPAFEAVIPFLSDACILADVASVKGNIPRFYEQCGFRFVSVHPMFGPTFANVDKLEDENVIIIKESDPEGTRFFKEFFKSFNLNIFEYSFDRHDQIIAYSLAFPFASTLVFAAHMDSAAVPGTTFKKHLDIAKGLLAEEDYLLAEILFSPYSLPQLEKVTQRLEFLKHIIKAKDYEEAQDFFQRLRKNIQT